MTNLQINIQLVDGVPVTSSLDVAVFFEKQHKNIIQSINSLISELEQDFSQLNFQPANYLDEQNKPRVMYFLTRDGFTLLAMGFTGKKAMQFKIAYIEAFNKMEEELKKQAQKSLVKKSYELEQNAREYRKPLSDLVKTWAKNASISYSSAWRLVNSYLKVKSITELPPERLPDAIAYVETQLSFLEQNPQTLPKAKVSCFSEQEKRDIVENLKELRDKALNLDNTRAYENAINRLKSYTTSLYKQLAREINPDYKGMTDPIIYTLHYQTTEAIELAQKSTDALRSAFNTAIAVTLMS